jgi:uncharacterized protein (DUF1684 family)
LKPHLALLLCAGLGFGTLSIGCSRSAPDRGAFAAALQHERDAKDRLFCTADGPLAPEQRPSFQGLRYWKPNAAFAVDARLESVAPPDSVRFPTSKGTFDPYVRLGRLHFQLQQRPFELTLYRSVEAGHLFLPFADLTSGRESYGAGRYIDIVLNPDGTTRLDFNRAYNPYCAYNAGWICPLTPPENSLDVRVEAGERSFEGGH